MKSQQITKVFWIRPLGTMNVCTKFYGNPSNICRDTSVRTKAVAQSRQTRLSCFTVTLVVVADYLSCLDHLLSAVNHLSCVLLWEKSETKREKFILYIFLVSWWRPLVLHKFDGHHFIIRLCRDVSKEAARGGTTPPRIWPQRHQARVLSIWQCPTFCPLFMYYHLYQCTRAWKLFPMFFKSVFIFNIFLIEFSDFPWPTPTGSWSCLCHLI